MSTRRTLQDVVAGFAGRADHPAIQPVGGETVRYGTLDRQVRQLAAGLSAAGVIRGERVGLLAPNGAPWISSALGIVASGAVVVPLDMMMPEDDLAHVLADSGARRVITVRDRATQVRELGAAEIFLLDADADEEAGRSWRSLLAEPTALPPLSPDDLAAHFYTSGTSGRPKGVPLTHGNIVANVEALLGEGLVAPDERACLPLPLFHVYPFVVGMLTPLAAQATLILPAGVSGPEIAQALQGERATALIGVPRLYDALLTAIRRRVEGKSKRAGKLFNRMLSASSAARRRGWNVGRLLFRPIRKGAAPDLRLLVSGGAKLEPDLAHALEGLGWEVLTGYGLTETSPIVTFNRRGRAKLDTAGEPLPGIELKIDAPDENGIGEVTVRGPNVFGGYHNLPDYTREVLSADGWFRTGDLGRLDPDGNLRLTGRRSAVLVLPGGKKLDPEAVEEVYGAHPAIREIGVLLAGNRLVAVAVPANPDGGDAVATAVREISPGLPSYRRVTDVAVTTEPLPRTSLGKIRRFQLAERYEAAKAGRRVGKPQELSPADQQLLAQPAARRVWDWLHQHFPDKPIAPDASLQADLGIDSLDWVSLTLDLQQAVGLRLTEEALAKVSTVRDLLQAATEAQAGGPVEIGTLTPEQSALLTPAGAGLRAGGTLLAGVNRAAFLWPFRLTVTGADRIPAGGRILFAPNHLSFLDPPAIGAAMPGAVRRRTWWAGFSDLLHSTPLRRMFSRAAQVFPVNELSPSSSLSFGKAVLERGDNLVWFPEGARSVDGLLQPLMPGIGLLIEQAAPTVVPVHIAGTYEAWPRGRTLPRPHPIKVSFGAPLTPDQLAAMGDGEERRERLVSGLQRALVDLARESR